MTKLIVFLGSHAHVSDILILTLLLILQKMVHDALTEHDDFQIMFKLISGLDSVP